MRAMHRKRATHRGIERSEDNQRLAGRPAWAAMLPGRAALRGSIGCLALLTVSACAVPGKLDELSKRYLPEQLQSAFSNQDKDTQVGANQPPPAAKRPAYVAPKSERQQVRSAQTMLAQLGYSPGPADGVFGPKSARAIRKYQQDVGVPTDGKLSPTLLAMLAESVRARSGSNHGPQLNGRRTPLYEVGDRFVYSDGLVETATDIKGDKVLWETNQQTIFTSYRNFLLPPIFHEAKGRSDRSRTDAVPNILWPLQVGKEASFSVVTDTTFSGRPDNRSRQTSKWRCRVDGTETLAVTAGSFDVFRVACTTSAKLDEMPTERVWYYAPTIGHYVRRIDYYESQDKTQQVDLVAVRLGGAGWPPAAKAGLGWAFQHALETKARGKSVEWSSSGVDAKVVIKPMDDLNAGEALYCRTFEQTVRRTNGERVYPGRACRSASGEWQIPGLRSEDG